MIDAPVLVIGGGVAGSACALRLRQLGINVDVAEKATFPRGKVCGCCIGGAGLRLLEQLSQRGWVEETGVPTRRWASSIGGRRIELELPDGVAISRQALDSRLLQQAAQAGASIRVPCQASIVESGTDGVTALLPGSPPAEVRYAAVVVAAGLNAAGLHEILPWEERPHGPFGIAYTAHCEAIEPGMIYMACDDDGYVGLVKLEDGRVDIAAALRSGAVAARAGSPLCRVSAILQRSQFPHWMFEDPSPPMTTPPLRRTRAAGRGRVLAIGDAAGYVEPFTGEGMTWAMRSGIAAAGVIAAGVGDLSRVGDEWNRQLSELLRGRKLACRTVTALLRWSLARRIAAAALSRWPALANPLIRGLSS